jgi:alanyl-tRNA synthetase
VPDRVESLMGRLEALEKEMGAIHSQRRGELAAELAAGAETRGEVSLVVATTPDLDVNSLRQLALGVRDRLGGRSVVVLGASHGGKGALVGVVSKDLLDKGVSAADILAASAAELGGGGSRDPEMAQAGGPHGERLGPAVELARDSAERVLAGL